MPSFTFWEKRKDMTDFAVLNNGRPFKISEKKTRTFAQTFSLMHDADVLVFREKPGGLGLLTYEVTKR